MMCNNLVNTRLLLRIYCECIILNVIKLLFYFVKIYIDIRFVVTYDEFEDNDEYTTTYYHVLSFRNTILSFRKKYISVHTKDEINHKFHLCEPCSSRKNCNKA